MTTINQLKIPSSWQDSSQDAKCEMILKKIQG